MLFGSRSNSLIGLDITTSSIKLLELTQSGKSYRAECYAAEATPPNSINEKSIVDAEAVGEAIRRAVKRSGSKAQEVAIAISGDSAITKVIQMPGNLGQNELEGQVEIQADQYIPFPMEEVSFDYEIVGPNENDPEFVFYLDHQSMASALDIEYNSVAGNDTGISIRIVDIKRGLPVGSSCLMVPRPEWAFQFWVSLPIRS